MSNTIRFCSPNELDSRISPFLQQYISPGENIAFCYEAKGVGWIAGAAGWILTILLTDHRLVSAMIKTGLMVSPDPTTRMIMLQDITNIETNMVTVTLREGLPCHLTITGIHSESSIVFKFFGRDEQYQYVLKYVSEFAARARRPLNYQPVDMSERLRQLAQLHSDGLITDQEYTQKREQIIRGL